jgi:SAM-dependent methyltransferase
MDLHDFEDVALNYDYYLKAVSNYGESFERFYLLLAKEYGKSGIIDIACGTGALTVPFAQKGYDVTALDLSEAMIEVTRKKLAGQKLTAELLTANMTDFSCRRKFSLAVIARSGFMHLTAPREQRQALLNIRNHLTDGGILTLNTFVPNPLQQAQQINTGENDYTLRAEYINHGGKKEKIYNAVGYNPESQIMSGNWKFETFDESGKIIDTRIRPLKMRQTYRTELEYLFELCGFEIVNVYGGFNREPAEGICNLIWIAKKSDGL